MPGLVGDRAGRGADLEQLYRLVHTLRSGSPDAVIHVSHDRAGRPPDPVRLRQAGVTKASQDVGGYGDWSHVQRYLDAVRWLRNSGPEVAWVVNLTAHDHPLRPVEQIEADLAASPDDGYLEHFDVFGPGSRWPRHRAEGRYLYRHRRLLPLGETAKHRLRPIMVVNRLQPWLRVHVAYGLTVGLRQPASVVPYDRAAATGAGSLRLYGGSAYATLRWPVALSLLELAEDPVLRRRFAHALSPEEAFMQTALLNHTGYRLVDDARRYWDFSQSAMNHPRVLGLDDLPAALASRADFGRKFTDPAVLDEIDRRTGVSPVGGGSDARAQAGASTTVSMPARLVALVPAVRAGAAPAVDGAPSSATSVVR